MDNKMKKFMFLILGSLISIPAVMAQSSWYGGGYFGGGGIGISPLNGFFNLLGTILNIPGLNSVFIQIAIFKLFIFLFVARVVISGSEKVGLDAKAGKIAGIFMGLAGGFFLDPYVSFVAVNFLKQIIIILLLFLVVHVVIGYVKTFPGRSFIGFLILLALLFFVMGWWNLLSANPAGTPVPADLSGGAKSALFFLLPLNLFRRNLFQEVKNGT